MTTLSVLLLPPDDYTIAEPDHLFRDDCWYIWQDKQGKWAAFPLFNFLEEPVQKYLYENGIMAIAYKYKEYEAEFVSANPNYTNWGDF